MITQSCLIKSRPSVHRKNTVHSIFASQALNKASHAKLVYADECLSFAKLHRHSDDLARFLLHKDIQIENLVAVLMDRSIEAVMSQLGVLKSGGAYLPLSPTDYPLARIQVILEDAQVNYVITQKKYKALVESLQVALGRELIVFFTDDQNDIAANEDVRPRLDEVQIEPDNLAYVMYTSGSTGKPKGVMISHQNIISSVRDTAYLNASHTDVILHAAPISFDAATFEIWGALLNGLDLHIIPDHIVHDFNTFADYIRHRPISIAWLTSALCNLLIDTRPDFFEFLSQLMVGGEALSAKHINQLRSRYPNLKVRNNYGPTENTIFSTSFLIEKNYESNIPIGSAITQKRAYILNEKLGRVPPGTSGILYVAGEGLARGYLNLPLETREKFIDDPFYKGERMYFTGDLCRYNAEGEIEYLGRIDDQVKLLGHRIELGEIETVLNSAEQVNQAVVLHKAVDTKIKYLAAYVDCVEEELEAVKAQLKAKLPHYMIPTYFEVLNDFPINTNGKLDRKAMLAWPVKARNEIELNNGLTQQTVQQTVLATCCEILNLQAISPDQNFFDLGGDSILGTKLIISLEQKLSISLPLSVLYAHPDMVDFIQCIQHTCINDQLTPFSIGASDKKVSGQDSANSLNLSQDAVLGFDIKLNGRTVHKGPNLRQETGHIFLTGATGFFGSFLLKDLLNTTQATIHCLVRANNNLSAQQRIVETLTKYNIPLSRADKNRIVAMPGDLTKPCLGLETLQFNELANTMDLIFHNGASVNYVDSYHTLKQPNVFGSHEVIRLSCLQRIIPLHYVSSVSVFETLGFFSGREMIYESDSLDASESYVRLGYSQSKWVAEKMMGNARAKGLPINIYRSGYIMGHAETGVSNTTDHIARYIAGCIEMGSAPILEEYASLAPVDQLSAALSYIATDSLAKGETFHLCNPTFVTVGEIYQKIKNFGFPLELVSYTQWKERLKVVPETNPLYPLLSLHIHSAPDHELTLPELYERNTRFDCQHLLTALEGSGLEIGLNDPNIFERWLNCYVQEGLISGQTFARLNAFKTQVF